MTQFWPFSEPVSLVQSLRKLPSAEGERTSELQLLADEKIEPIHRPERVVFGEKSSKSGYYTTFFANTRKVPERFLAEIPSGYLYSPKFYLFDSKKRIILESLPPATREATHKLREQDSFNTSPILNINEDVLVCGVHNFDNYFHWHIDCMAGLAISKSAGVERKIIVPRLSPWRRASLSYMGFELDRIIVGAEGTFRFNKLAWPSSLVRRGFSMSQEVADAFGRIKAGVKAAGKLPAIATKKLYIGRTDTRVRQLLNEAELIAKLESLGFTIMIPGKVSYEEQIALSMSAEVIVALHGAGLTNMGFAPQECRIVEIFPETFINNGYYGLSQVTKQRYHTYSKNVSTGENGASGQPEQWTIDVKDFLDEYGDIIN